MYRKALIPMDMSKEAQGVFPRIQDELAPGAEVILLHVTPPAHAVSSGGHLISAAEIEEGQVLEAKAYLRVAAQRYGEGANWRHEVIRHRSVPDGIVEFAEQEGVDLIAMYTHDRKGLGALIGKSVASSVSKKAPIEVRIFKPVELAAA